jgi:hypothetical protein
MMVSWQPESPIYGLYMVYWPCDHGTCDTMKQACDYLCCYHSKTNVDGSCVFLTIVDNYWGWCVSQSTNIGVVNYVQGF